MNAHVDAELVGLCERFIALEEQYRHVHNVLHRDDDHAADAAGDPIKAEQGPVLDAICDQPPRTIAGVLAIARALASYRSDALVLDCPDDRLLDALLDGAAAVDGDAEEPSPLPSDAGLVADCAAFDALEQEVHDIHGDQPRKDAARERLYKLQRPVVTRIVQARATTVGGHVARARSLILWDPSVVGPGSGDSGERILHGLLRDLAGQAFVDSALQCMRAGNEVGMATDALKAAAAGA